MNQTKFNAEVSERSKKTAIAKLVTKQRDFFESSATKDVSERIKQLKKFRKVILDNEQAIYSALNADFGKSIFETYTSEIGLVLSEIGVMLKNIKKWTAPELVGGDIANFPSKSYIYPEPFGVTLVMGAWNYPFQLTIAPGIGAIAAGNTVIFKPSRTALHTAKLIATLIGENFDERYIAVADENVDHNDLLDQKYDYIFFTGGTEIGKVVARAAAENLIPTTLELGGKSPCIVDQTADIAITAKRIVWGKFFNAGQTCVAPDYLLVHSAVKDRLFAEMTKCIKEFYGENPIDSPDYPRIINDRHFIRLSKMLKGGSIVFGGDTNAEDRYISPTLITDIDFDHSTMSEEIFGPILPAFTIDSIEEAISIVKNFPKPLAFYIFSNNYENQQKAINNVQFGGGCINDCISHLVNHNLPFGGIGPSGSGAYHGKFSFDTFTHRKAILNKVFWPDVPLRYPPYNGKLFLVKQVIN